MKRLFTIIALTISILAIGNNANAQAPITEYSFDNTLNNASGNAPFSGPEVYTANRNLEEEKALLFQNFNSRTATIANLPVGTADRSISIWYKVISTNFASPYPAIFSYGELATGKLFGFYLNGTGGIVHQGYAYDYTLNSVTTNLNEWYHLVVVFQSQTVKVYINNQLKMDVPRPSINTGAGTFSIGGNFTGALDDLKIYDRALTAAEVDAMYNSEPPTYPYIATRNIYVNSANIGYTITGGAAISSANIKFGTSPTALNASMALSTGNTPLDGTTTLSGLSPNTTYYYQIEATNSFATSQSQVYSFTTSTYDMVANFTFDGTLYDLSRTKLFSGGGTYSMDRNNQPSVAVGISAARTVSIPALPTGNADRTISIWYNINNFNGLNYPGIFSYGTNSVNQMFGAYLDIAGSKIVFQAHTNDVPVTQTTALNTWYHLVITLQGGKVKVYVNNVLKHTFTPSVALNTSMLNDFRIGDAFFGAIDELKIYNRALNAPEVANLYAQNRIPTPTVVEYTFNNVYTNVAGTAPFAANAGTSFVTDRHGNANSALNIAETGTTATIVDLPYGVAPRTVSVWVKRNANNVFGNSSVYHYGHNMGYDLSVTAGDVRTSPDGSNQHIAGTTNNLNVWDHLVNSYDGTTSKLYKNGALLSAITMSLNTENNSDIFKLGLNRGDMPLFDGAVDDLKIYNYALTDTEVANLYNTNTLPVNLVSFTAKAQNNSTMLNWETASETNNSHFIVKRSVDGVNFNELAKVDAKSNNGAKYQHIDKSPSNGTNYYQLLQVDLDGKTTDLGVKVLNFGFSTPDIQLYPNPTTDKVEATFSAGSFNSAKLTDINGRVLQNISISKLQQSVTITVSNYPKGVYLLQLQGNGKVSVQKIIKE